MSIINKRTLRQTVIDRAVAVAKETAEYASPALAHSDGLPAEGTMLIVTEADRRLWKAALQLASFKRRSPARRRRSR